MEGTSRWLAALAALSGLCAVAFGAFGAHGAATEQAKAWLETGGRYQGVHALAALVALALKVRFGSCAAIAFLLGATLFAGSLYAMALGGPRVLGALTPFGGGALMVGWAILLFGILRTRS